jgi:hypothetical protein
VLRIDKPVLQDPLISQRSPFETYLLVIGVIAGLQVLVGTEVSGSIENLSDEIVTLWGLFLFVGCLVALLGMATPTRKVHWMLFGLHVERFGLTLLAGACGLFSWVMFTEVGEAGAFVAGQNLAFAGACITRVVQIARRFSWYYHQPDGAKPGAKL